jgi:hypothetical protein
MCLTTVNKALIMNVNQSHCEGVKMKPIKKELGTKYETIRITPEAKKICIEAAIEASKEQGRIVSLVEIASKAIIEKHKK